MHVYTHTSIFGLHHKCAHCFFISLMCRWVLRLPQLSWLYTGNDESDQRPTTCNCALKFFDMTRLTFSSSRLILGVNTSLSEQVLTVSFLFFVHTYLFLFFFFNALFILPHPKWQLHRKQIERCCLQARRALFKKKGENKKVSQVHLH